MISMKKIIVLAMAAFLISGVSFAHEKTGKAGSKSGKECCKKGGKECSKDCSKKGDSKNAKAAKTETKA